MNHCDRSSASVRYRQTVSTGASSVRSSRIVSSATRSTGTRICAAASAIFLLLLFGFDERLEAVETDRPEFLPLLEPALGLGHRLGIKAAKMREPDLSPRQE